MSLEVTVSERRLFLHWLEICSGVWSTSLLTQTYCWCKSCRSCTLTLLPWIFKQRCIYTCTHLCLVLSGQLLLAWSYVGICCPFRSKLHCLFLYILRSDVFSVGLLGTQKCWGVSTLMHHCSKTDDTPPDLSVHFTSAIKIHCSIFHCLFAGGAPFSSRVKWIKWASSQKHCSFHTLQ